METKTLEIMKHWLWILFCSGVILFPNCSSGTKAADEVTIEEKGGVTYVHNPAAPLHPEKSSAFTEEMRIEPEDSEGNVIYSRPGFFLVDGRGYMYIADVQELDFKVFDPEGSLVHTIGASGSGPGEFQYLDSAGFTPDGRLLVLDSGLFRTSFFDADGTFLDEFRWSQKYGSLYLIKENSYLTQEYIPDEKGTGYGLSIAELDFNGQRIRTYGEFSPPESQDMTIDGKTFGMTIPRSPSSVFAGDRKTGRLYHCWSSEYIIEVYDSNGQLIRVIDRPYTRPAFTAAEKSAIREQVKASLQGKIGGSMPDIKVPSYKPVTDFMVVDESGNLWVVTNETKDENGTGMTAVDIFDSEGRYDTRVWVEHIPQLFKNGKMYRFAVDDLTGYTSLVRYSVSWIQ
jgi:hypothetical protein